MSSFLTTVRVHAFPLLLAVGLCGLLALYGTTDVRYAPDSPTYLDFHPHRTAGYPLLLDAVEFLFGDLRPLPMLQLAFWLGVVFYAGLSLRGRVHPAALLPALLLIAYIPQIRFGLYDVVMADSVFASLAFLSVGGAVRFAARPGWRTALLISVALGLAVVVRPPGLALAIMLPALLWLAWPALRGWHWRRRVLLLVALLLPMPALYGAEYGYWLTERHDPAWRNYAPDMQAFAWTMLEGEKPLLLDDPGLTAMATRARDDPGVVAARAMLRHAPTWQTRIHMYVYAVTVARATYVADPLGLGDLPVDTLTAIKRIGRHGVRQEPARYAFHALEHYGAYWLAWFSGSPRSLALWDEYYENYVAGRLTIPGIDENFAIWDARWHYPKRILMLTMLGATALALGWACWRRLRPAAVSATLKQPESLAVAAVCAAGAHAMLLLTALASQAEFRYLTPAMPMLCVCVLLTTVCVADNDAARRIAALWSAKLNRRMRHD